MAKEKKPVVADADDLATLQAKHEALLEEVDTLARNMARLEAENADLREKVKELSVRNSALIDPPAPPPPGPSGCAGGGPATWTVGGHTCTSDVSTANASSPARRQPLQHGQAQLLQQVTGATRGHLLEVCADGVWQQRLAACAPASHCAGPWRTTRDGGRTVYRLDGTIPVGQAGYAMANDGSTLRVRCDAGIIRAAPQCQAGQEVVRTRTWERTTYRYSGPPVEPGALVRAHEVARVDTRTTPPTALQTGVRAVMAPCGADGRLQ